MKVNTVTQLWENLNAGEIQEMRAWSEDAVLRGKLPPSDPPWLLLWYKEMGYSLDRDRLLLQSVAVPQRVLLSIVKALSEVDLNPSEVFETLVDQLVPRSK